MQILHVNKFINAVVAERFTDAREEAERADAAVAEWMANGKPDGALPPFHGVPCSVKECFAVRCWVDPIQSHPSTSVDAIHIQLGACGNAERALVLSE